MKSLPTKAAEQTDQLLSKSLMAPGLNKNRQPLTTDGLPILTDTKKLAVCNDEEIKQPVLMAMILCGLRAQNFPTDLLKLVLHNFIRTMYPDYTKSEFAFAFKMALARRLPDLDNPSCFENFSCEYIGRVLSAYERWNPKPKDPRFGTIEGISDQRAHEEWRKKVQTWYDRYLAGEYIDFIPGHIHWILTYDGAFKERGKKREYQKFIRVMRYFAYAKENGVLLIYQAPEDEQQDNMIDPVID